MRQGEIFTSLNRGEISLLALARTDLEHLRMAAQSQVNWLPRILGPMMLRPGSEYIGEIYQDKPCKMVRFVAAFADTALIELTDSLMRVWVNDALVTRAAVATTVPGFGGSWTLTTTGTAIASIGGGILTFGVVNHGAAAIAVTSASVASGDQATEHAVRIVISNGPVKFQIGSSSGADDVFSVETLDTGTYSMAFTPGVGVGTIYLQFSTVVVAENNNTLTQSVPQGLQLVSVSSCAIESAGVLTIPTPWPLSVISPAPSRIRTEQSADVIYVACPGIVQHQINRYSPTSWSVVTYRPVKGPMSVVQGDSSILIAPAGTNGNTTLTSNRPIFKPADVGTLFRLFHAGQIVSNTISFESTYSDCVRISGVSYVSTVSGGSVINTATPDRTFNVIVTGTWVGTLTLQRSFEGPTTGFTVLQQITTNGTTTINDGLNNEIIWYRLGFDPGNYTSGSAIMAFVYGGGGFAGVCHVTNFVNSSEVDVEVLVPFSNTSNASNWRQSEWSSFEGYPTSTVLHEGRLWWAGADRWWGSMSDDYVNFDYDATGDAAYIDATIGQGPIANINWLLSLDHLIGGADTSIIYARSDAVETPLTPANFNLRQSVTNGAFPIQAVRIDQRGVYVDQSGRRLYELIYDIQLYNYKPRDLTRLNPDIGIPGFVDMSSQRQPDTRINLTRTDGILASFVYDVDDEVEAFWKVQTLGNIESSVELPGTLEDQVYIVVNRTIQGVTKRYLEKFARIDEAQGGPLTKCVDAHVVYQGAATNVLPGYGHLIGQEVCIWGNSADLGTAVVSDAGTVTIPNGVQVTAAVGGLPYSAEFISTKLAYAAKMGSAINQMKRIDHLGLVMSNTHCQGVRYGKFLPNDPDNVVNGVFTIPPVLDNLPLIEYGAPVPSDRIWSQYDTKMFEMPTDTDTDVRLYLQAASPRPATILGVTFGIDTSN